MSPLQSLDLVDGPLRFAGAIGLRRGDGYVRPFRLPPDQLDLFAPELISMAALPAGVRITLASDTRRLVVEVEQVGVEEWTYVWDLLIDGTLRESRSSPGVGPKTLEFADLPAGGKRLELWLPTAGGVRVRSVSVDAGARVEPLVESRPRWITYGSSITHCLDAASPTRTWPALAAASADLDLLALGYAGQCHFDPLVARMIRDQPADCISLKLGINVQGGGTFTERSFAASVQGFVETVRDGHPRVPLSIVSPILSPEREDIAGPGGLTLRRIREILEDLVDTRRKRGDTRLAYLSGLELFGEADLEHLPDGLHPNDAGNERIGRRFAELQFGPDGPLRPL